MNPQSNDWWPYNKRKNWIQIHIEGRMPWEDRDIQEDYHVKKEAEIGVIQTQARNTKDL